MSIREQVAEVLETLSEDELQQVSDYLAFLKFRARLEGVRNINVAELTALYAEFADEDRLLAEEGMGEYAAMLNKEDEA